MKRLTFWNRRNCCSVRCNRSSRSLAFGTTILCS